MMYHMRILHNQKIKMLTHYVFQQKDKFMTCKEFSSHMKQLTNEQKAIVDDFLYRKIKNCTKPFPIF